MRYRNNMPSKKKNPSLLTQVAIDIVLFSVVDDALSVVLIKRQWAPFEGFAALPGAFLHASETTLKAAQRVLKEKVGLAHPPYMEQLYTFDASGRDPRGQFPTVTYMTLVPEGKLKFAQVPTAQEPRFVAVGDLPSLGFDHATIIGYALRRLRMRLEYTNIIYSLLPTTFTLTQLQQMYERVLGRRLDKRNFRKKFLSLGLVRATRRFDRSGHRRPARLYTFINRTPTELKKFF